jgi:predicted DNA-binding transcriptional regulator YafY
LEKRLRDSFGVLTGAGEFDVVICFDELAAEYIREKRWHPSQQLTELEDGGIQLRLKLSSLAEIHRWILSWGGRATALAPVELVESVRAAARAILYKTR